MKRTLIVTAIAAMLLFAVAGSAFAAGINHSGQTGVGLWENTPVAEPAPNDAMLYVDWATALTIGDTATEGNSPHGNYTTTTAKCVVCHAVHYAAPVSEGGTFGDYTVASGNQDADTLLRMKASQACVFCHATAGFSVNGKPVYNGLGNAIVGPGNTGGNTDNGHITGDNCTYCHTNVHGAGADDSVASLQGYLLKKMSATDVQNTGADTDNMFEAMQAIDNNAVNQGFDSGDALGASLADYATNNSPALREKAVGVFCAECHLGAYATAAPGAATNVYGSGTASYSGHRLVDTVDATWNGEGEISSGEVQGLTIAWAASPNCKSCHDAADDFGNDSFPHSWGRSGVNSAKMWLLSAADAGAAASSLGQASLTEYDDERVQLYDGVCLKCHVAPGGAEGVGITF